MNTLGRRALVALVPLLLCVPVVLTLPDIASAGTAPECRRTLPSYPLLHVGDRSRAVRTLQCGLNDVGVGPVVVDGYYGPQTRDAVWSIAKNFEAEPEDPYEITPGFWMLLYGCQLPQRVLEQGDRGPAVRNLQRALRAVGYAIVVDGDFGPQTREVLVSFQERVGHRPSGRVDLATRFMLATGGYA